LSCAGEQHEALLRRQLTEVGAVFQSEEELRGEGFFKTPDVKLQVEWFKRLLLRSRVFLVTSGSPNSKPYCFILVFCR
jgi:Protein of unknown function TPD sequence-motif